MSNSKDEPNTAENAVKTRPDKKGASIGHARSTMSKSMHDGVEVWCDCCSCEAEPYWVEAMQEQEQQQSN